MADPKKALSPEDRRMHVMLALLALAIMINVLGFSVIIPLIPDYVQSGMHLRDAQDPRIGEYGGWLGASYALMQFLFAPFWGRLSDRVGRKPILIGSLIGDAVFYTIFGLSTHNIYGQFAARILAGIFSSASLAVAQAYAADITPPHLRAMGLGYIGAAFGLGFILGPAVGGMIGQIGLAWPLYFSALLALANLAWVARYLPEPERAPLAAGATPATLTSRFALMTQAVRGPMGFLYLLTFAVTFAFGNLEGTFAVYLKQRLLPGSDAHHSVVVTGYVFAYVGVLIVIVQGFLIRRLVKRFGEPNLVVVGIGLMALGFLAFPFAPVLALLLVGPMIPISLGNGLNGPSLRSLVSRKATAQGAALGLSASFDSLARATGPATAGYLYKHVGQTAPYWCAGLVMSVCFLFALARKREMAEGISTAAPTGAEKMAS
jgi:DHA1 family tetracycline resistance protein-like MFS transporter